MTREQKIIKYAALGLAALLILGMIWSAISALSWFFNDEQVTEDLRVVELDSTFNRLDLELGATSLTVKQGDTLQVETNNSRLSFAVNGNTLSVEEERRSVFGNSHEAILILTVPADLVFTEVEIQAGAGKISVDALSAEHVSLELGAGSVTFERLNVSGSAEIMGGAGSLEIRDGNIRDLDLEMGVGELILTAALVGENELDCGIGSTDITLLGAASDYTVSVSKGAGSFKLNGKEVTSGTSSSIGNGANQLTVDGGLGDIDITLPAE